MTDVLEQARRTIENYDLLVPGETLVVGVSGGPDSLCLLHVLRRLREAYHLRLHVAHLNHSARGSASDADADFVAQIAAEWELASTVEKRDVPALAEEHDLALEEAARRARYAFLAQVAQDIGAHKVAVGHNADDQAETVLMHFLRGTGLAGLRGMLPLTHLKDYHLIAELAPGVEPLAAIDLIRPLLETTRADIERYCADHGLSPRFDRSNLDVTYFRNRLRHELLPLLEEYNPNIRQRLCHTAAVAAADYEVLTQLRDQAWGEVVREEREGTSGLSAIVFDLAEWQELPVALQRSTLRHAAYQLRKSLRDVTFVHVENARKIALQGETGAQATLPKELALTVGYDTFTIGDAEDAGPPPDEPLLWRDEPLPVQVPGTTPLPESSWSLEAKVLKDWDMEHITTNPDPRTAYFDAEALKRPLVLRPRRRGDRFHPYGMGGHTVQVSDLMIDLKIPRAWRDHVPLLVAGDEIVWVCGRRISESAIVRPDTKRVMQLSFTT